MKVCPVCSREVDRGLARCPYDGAQLVDLDTNANRKAGDLIGQVVDGRWRVEQLIGKGGMGAVYAVRHVVVGKMAALKVLKGGVDRSDSTLQRFIREAQTANAVKSRHIVEASDFGQLEGGSFYMVMDLLEGQSLTAALKGQHLDRQQLLHVFVQIADATHEAHQVGVIHRDLKPENVFLVHEQNDPCFVKLLDFGVAKVTQSQNASNLTETGVIVGTPYYMSPEQARAVADIDHRTDIYALGVMMYRAFTGRLPFVADSAMGVLTAHITEMPQPPSSISGVDVGLERVILRCLEKERNHRYPTMADVAVALRQVASGQSVAAQVPPSGAGAPSMATRMGSGVHPGLSGSSMTGPAVTGEDAETGAARAIVRESRPAQNGGSGRTIVTAAIVSGLVVAGAAGAFFAFGGGGTATSAAQPAASVAAPTERDEDQAKDEDEAKDDEAKDDEAKGEDADAAASASADASASAEPPATAAPPVRHHIPRPPPPPPPPTQPTSDIRSPF